MNARTTTPKIDIRDFSVPNDLTLRLVRRCGPRVEGSGVYEITVEGGKRYIGSSVDIKKRMRVHFWELCKGDHCVPELQAAWNALGPSAFSWRVNELIEVPRNYFDALAILRQHEQVWIDRYGLENLYNRDIAYSVRRRFRHIRKITVNKRASLARALAAVTSVSKEVSREYSR